MNYSVITTTSYSFKFLFFVVSDEYLRLDLLRLYYISDQFFVHLTYFVVYRGSLNDLIIDCIIYATLSSQDTSGTLLKLILGPWG